MHKGSERQCFHASVPSEARPFSNSARVIVDDPSSSKNLSHAINVPLDTANRCAGEAYVNFL